MGEESAAPQASPEQEKEKRTTHPVAKAIGAVFRGYRQGDEETRSRVHRVGKKVGAWSAVIAALTLAGQVVSLLSASMKHEWEQASEDRKALVAALDRQTEKLGTQAEKVGALTERIGDLVEATKSDRDRRDADHAAIIERLKGRR